VNAERVEAVAQPQVWTVGPDETLESIARGLVERRLHWVPVVDASGALLGVLSAWDLLRFNVEGRPPSMPAWQACTYRPASVAPDTPLPHARQLMREHRVHHLPVLAADQRLVGVLSSLDLVD
jgi:CBS domain-containing protein